MLRSVVIAMACLISIPVQAQYVVDGWLVSANGNGCFVYRKIGSGDFNNIADVEIYAIFDNTLNIRKSRPLSATEIDMKRSKLQIQIVPQFPSWYSLKKELIVVVLSGEPTTPLVRDSSFDSDPRPRFDFVGAAAEGLFEKLRNGDDVVLTIQYNSKEKITVALAATKISAGMATPESCMSEVHRDERQ